MSKARFPPLSSKRLQRIQPTTLRLRTTAGPVQIEVAYGQDPQSKQWLCPMRVRWGLGTRQEISPELDRRLCFTATLAGSYETAAQLSACWDCPVDDATIQAHVCKAGRRAEDFAAERVERALSPQTRSEVVAEAAKRHGGREFSLVIEIDGWMIRDRGLDWGLRPPEREGSRVEWHEVKTGALFCLEQRGRTGSGRPILNDKAMVIHRGEPHEFGRRLYAEALRRGLMQARAVYVVADGAVWIWNVVADRFGWSKGVLDFYHAAEHLWAVAHALHPQSQDEARQWVEPLLHQLRHGEQARVITTLEQWIDRAEKSNNEAGEVLRRETDYFKSHRDRMAYPAIAERGCPIGSGAVESACGQLQGRFKRTGQFWTQQGSNFLFALDLARRNGDWDEIWSIN